MIIDTIKASEAESGDLLLIETDEGEHRLEETTVIDKGDSVVITGYSHLTGDSEVFHAQPFDIIHIWTE